MKMYSSRLNYFYGLLVIIVILGFSVHLQIKHGINPCPLCILQRITMGVLGVIFFMGMTLDLKKVGRVVVALLSLTLSAIGMALSGRQVWLQHLPASQNTDCGASLQYMLKVLPLDQVFLKIFSGSAECSQIDWQFFGLSMAGWALICFIAFALFSLGQVFVKK